MKCRFCGYEWTPPDSLVQAVETALNFESDYEVEEDDRWLFDSKRDPVDQAKILRSYKP